MLPLLTGMREVPGRDDLSSRADAERRKRSITGHLLINLKENVMHRTPLVLAVALLCTAPAVFASGSKKPVSKWTCADFLAVDDQYKPKVIYAATAYSRAGKPEADVIDIEGTETVTPMVVDECTKAPQASFTQKLKAAWDKVAAKVK
jgi:acid stress chaperone HdeA